MSEKILKFRDELIKLLNKYNYSIQGTVLDDGTMEVEDNNGSESYILSSGDNYTVYDSDYKYVADDYILSRFGPEQNAYISYFGNNIGIITNSRFKAQCWFYKFTEDNKDNIEWYKQSQYHIEVLTKDGKHYKWIQPNQSSRANKLGSAYIDRDVTLEELEYIILPMCFCSKENIKII